ncbi:ferric reductase-like transmembrane domain-containing protein [Microbacterium sp.]|uniref:ferredoxin reductase family protein n=1 Tax=Microbacterium sp. TaxID=51671 RepID=UPI0025FB80C3|nr:ferric reductase-like transmembrane domain-containing protein [Microbacterium sp.]
MTTIEAVALPQRVLALPVPVPRPRGRQTAWTIGAITVVWGTSLMVAALWVVHGGISAMFGGPGAALTSAGRVTGLVAANLLLLQVLLMARIPLFERGFGRDGITRAHRITGFWSFWLMFAHIGLLVVGYAADAGVAWWVQLWDFVWNYPGMLLATAGTLALVAVVVSSARRARRRLRYESWHLLHLYAYLGVALAVPHMLWTGGDFLGDPVSTAYWWTLWAVAAASIVAFRIVVPLARSAYHGIRVESVRPDGTRGVAVRMTGRRLGALRAEAGQFFIWRFLDGPGWTRGHPFSLAADPAGGGLEIAVALAGDDTRRLAGVQPGTRVLVEGPYGTMTGRVRRSPRMLMIGAGAGVAPLIGILEAERFAPGAATLIVRDHDAAASMRGSQIARLVAERGLRFVHLSGSRRRGASSWMPATHAAWSGADLLRHIAGGLEDTDVFLCGPEAWMAAVRADLRSAGVSADLIHSESFAL